jgi:hypothetical protein
VRLYRVRWFFRYLEYDLSNSLLAVTVARNLVVRFVLRWASSPMMMTASTGRAVRATCVAPRNTP